MITLKLCLVAEGVIVDKRTNQLSFYGLLEGIASAGFPLFVQRVGFLALWERDDGDPETAKGTFAIRIGDEELFKQKVDVNFLGKKRCRTIVAMNGLMVPKPGQLEFCMSVPEYQDDARYQVEVSAGKPQIQAEGNAGDNVTAPDKD